MSGLNICSKELLWILVQFSCLIWGNSVSVVTVKHWFLWQNSSPINHNQKIYAPLIEATKSYTMAPQDRHYDAHIQSIKQSQSYHSMQPICNCYFPILCIISSKLLSGQYSSSKSLYDVSHYLQTIMLQALRTRIAYNGHIIKWIPEGNWRTEAAANIQPIHKCLKSQATCLKD